MTSLNRDETTGTVDRTENYTLFEFPSEAILECCGPVEWPVSLTFADVEKAVVMFTFFVIEVLLVSGPTTADAKDAQESLGFRLVSVRIIGVSFSNGTSGEGVLS